MFGHLQRTIKPGSQYDAGPMFCHLSSLRQFVNGAASGRKSLTKRNAGVGSSSTPPSGLQRLTN